MIFITLCRFRGKPTKESAVEASKLVERSVKEGGKILVVYWTLGRYDAVVIAERPDEKAEMRALLRSADKMSTETLVAIPRDEALKLLE